ncbi:cobalt-precorrin-6A reductase [Actinacidiphila acididurans]|uniref:Cobalt-precorrin-6A reductase n=1 Tax=Actinacidiphila acididurans TaxID=2784346 RepID=A0ABS2U1M4_9ACTN|nr:cobalt-precorrin-6A reductase [Actinacidiphila acididurans]MBM9509508.1 cobalt-precorrin-6A reductase [Actinacidiphila acididurans]
MRRVLILGGTGEARVLAGMVAEGEPGTEAITSLAGRTVAPVPAAGRHRTGGFGGVAALVAYLREERVDAVVDATHPFAERITAQAVVAAADAGVPLLVLRRPGWTAGDGDRWHLVDGLAEAAALLPGLGSRAFLTTGRGGLAAFAGLGLFFLIRSVEPPDPPLPSRHHLLLDRGPFTLAGERALLREHRIDVLVTKDSGGPATAPKLAAARAAEIPVLIVTRPPLPPGVPTAPDPVAALAWLRALPER